MSSWNGSSYPGDGVGRKMSSGQEWTGNGFGYRQKPIWNEAYAAANMDSSNARNYYSYAPTQNESSFGCSSGYIAIDASFHESTMTRPKSNAPETNPRELYPLQRFTSCTNVINRVQPPFEPPSNITSWCDTDHRTDQSSEVDSRRTSIESESGEQRVKRYRCKECKLDFDTRCALQTHMTTHQLMSKKRHQCPECTKSFFTNTHLAQHMRTHSQDRPFGPCDHCGKTFVQLSHLQQHMRVHTGEKPYKCAFSGCEKSFAQLSNLQNHSRKHEAPKPFKCHSCYKSFDVEQALLDHIPLHMRSKHVRVHVCHYCGKSYARYTYLRKHLDEHSNSKNNESHDIALESELLTSYDSFDNRQTIGNFVFGGSSMEMMSGYGMQDSLWPGTTSRKRSSCRYADQQSPLDKTLSNSYSTVPLTNKALVPGAAL